MRRRLIVCAGISAATLLALRRRHRHVAQLGPVLPAPESHAPPHGRPTLRLIPALALFVTLFVGFPIPGPWDDIKDAATGVAAAIKNWVVDLLTSIFNFLWEWARNTVKWAIDGFTDIWKFARDLDEWALRVVNNLVTLIAQRLQDAYNFTMANLHGLRNEVLGWLAAGAGAVVDLVGWGAKIITDAYNLVAEKIYWPLWHLIQDVYKWVNVNVLAQIPGMISGAINAAIGGLMALPNLVSTLWHWVWDYADDLLRIVNGAKDFLLFVISHPLTWWMEYLQRIVDSAPDMILRGVANAVERNAPAMEDLAVKIIGA